VWSLCCYNVKLCALAAQAFQSQESGAVTRRWRWCQVHPEPTTFGITAIDIPIRLDSLFYSCYEFIVRPICGVIMSPHYFPTSQALDDLQQWCSSYPLYNALLSDSRWIGNLLNHSSNTVSVSPSCLSAHVFNHTRFSDSN